MFERTRRIRVRHHTVGHRLRTQAGATRRRKGARVTRRQRRVEGVLHRAARIRRLVMQRRGVMDRSPDRNRTQIRQQRRDRRRVRADHQRLVGTSRRDRASVVAVARVEGPEVIGAAPCSADPSHQSPAPHRWSPSSNPSWCHPASQRCPRYTQTATSRRRTSPCRPHPPSGYATSRSHGSKSRSQPDPDSTTAS